MYYIIILVIVLTIAMARSGRGRAMGRYIRGEVDEELTIGGLTTRDVVSVVFDETVNERTLISSLVASYSMDEWTPTANAGPIMVGIAHSDYSAAEIEEWIENTGSWDEGDLVNQEVGKRKIRKVGIFPDTGNVLSNEVLNDGKAIKTKLNWILNQGQTLQVWAYNLGGASVATTTPSIHVEGHANLFPK